MVTVAGTIVAASIVGWVLFVAAHWFAYRLFVVPQADATTATGRLQWIAHAGNIIWMCTGFLLAAYAFYAMPSGLIQQGSVVGALALSGSILSLARVLALDRTDLLERAGIERPSDAVRSGLFWGIGWFGGLGLVAVVLSTTMWAGPVVVFAGVVSYHVFGSWLSDRLSDTAPVPTDCASRLEALAADADCADVRFRLVDSTVPNAEATGILPGRRTIYLTEPAVAELSPTDIDAIVAHELAHFRRGHLRTRAVLSALLWSGLVFAIFHSLPVLFAVGIGFLLLGMYRSRTEYQADAVAASLTSSTAMATALERLTELGDLPRETSRLLALLNHHPSIGKRIDELEAQ